MSDVTTDTPKKSMKKRGLVVGAGLLAAGIGIGTFAAFTSDATLEADFAAGSVDLTLNDVKTDTWAPELDNLRPGDVGFYSVAAKNNGTINGTFGADASASGDLATDLKMGIAVVSDATCDAGTYAAGTNLSPSGTAIGASDITAGQTLDAGATKYLCYRVELPSATGNSQQGNEVSASWDFTLTQV